MQNLWRNASHEYHKNWATTNSYDSTVLQIVNEFNAPSIDDPSLAIRRDPLNIVTVTMINLSYTHVYYKSFNNKIVTIFLESIWWPLLIQQHIFCTKYVLPLQFQRVVIRNNMKVWRKGKSENVFPLSQ